eukprot:2628703-Amphidinium_carterae.1
MVKTIAEPNDKDQARQATMPFDIYAAFGRPIGVWNIDEWQRIDIEGAATLWLDHSTSTWSQSDTQWHLNEFSAVTMFNTHSMSSTFRNWCKQNIFSILSKYLEADGKTIKQQYVSGQWRGTQPQSGNGIAPLASKQSHGFDQAADGNPRQQQWTWNRLAVDKPSDNFSVTMTVENEFTLHFAQLQQSGGTRQ